MAESNGDLAVTASVQPGERLSLPADLIEKIGPGVWVVTVRPARTSDEDIRLHGAFLNGYTREDEGLYDEHRSEGPR